MELNEFVGVGIYSCMRLGTSVWGRPGRREEERGRRKEEGGGYLKLRTRNPELQPTAGVIARSIAGGGALAKSKLNAKTGRGTI